MQCYFHYKHTKCVLTHYQNGQAVHFRPQKPYSWSKTSTRFKSGQKAHISGQPVLNHAGQPVLFRQPALNRFKVVQSGRYKRIPTTFDEKYGGTCIYFAAFVVYIHLPIYNRCFAMYARRQFSRMCMSRK